MYNYLPNTHAPCITVPIPLLYVCIYVQHHAQLNEHNENLSGGNEAPGKDG